MDFSLYPSTFLPNTNLTVSPDPFTPFCTESFLLGRLILGLYGYLVPLTVSNFKSMCSSTSSSSCKNTLVHFLHFKSMCFPTSSSHCNIILIH